MKNMGKYPTMAPLKHPTKLIPSTKQHNGIHLAECVFSNRSHLLVNAIHYMLLYACFVKWVIGWLKIMGTVVNVHIPNY